jgi:hypothetical protein
MSLIIKIVVNFNLKFYLYSNILQKRVKDLVLIAIDNVHLKNI